MAELRLAGLVGTDPLGFLAALGTLDVASRAGLDARLRWTDEIEPAAILDGVSSMADLVALADGDRVAWQDSPLLTWRLGDALPPDVKLHPGVVPDWVWHAREHSDRCHVDLLTALVAEGAVAGTGESKPTHLHFTAGQQKFLVMVRTLAASVSAGDLEQALLGPWLRDSSLPVLGWEAGGERVYALRGFDPGPDKKLGTPGADWLAFLGVTFFPVVNAQGRLLTTACSREWKRSWFRWPLWRGPVGSDVVRSLVADSTLWSMDAKSLGLRGVSRVLHAPIRRSDQGGYGSFGPPTDVSPSPPVSDGRRTRRLAARSGAGTGR